MRVPNGSNGPGEAFRHTKRGDKGSSNLERMTTLGSSGVKHAEDPPTEDGVLAHFASKKLPARSSVYPGRQSKLSGFRTTTYVPGMERSAFISRSISFVKHGNGGKVSTTGDELGLEIGDLTGRVRIRISLNPIHRRDKPHGRAYRPIQYF